MKYNKKKKNLVIDETIFELIDLKKRINNRNFETSDKLSNTEDEVFAQIQSFILYYK